ncbi:MAG: universal stress protein [Natronomonas sp.]
MSNTLSETTILVPFDASDPGEPSPALVDLLSPHRVVVLGYYPVPDQSSTDQLRDEFGDEANEAAAEIASRFADRGAGADSVVVFTHDRSKTIDRIAAEHGVDAVLTEGPIGEELEQIFVPLRGDGNLESIVSFLEALLTQSTATVTLFNVPEDDEEDARGEFLLRGAQDRLLEAGVDPERVTWEQKRSGSPGAAIVEAAEAYDLIVTGETEPSLRERLLGDVTDRIITQSSHPVLVVRN